MPVPIRTKFISRHDGPEFIPPELYIEKRSKEPNFPVRTFLTATFLFTTGLTMLIFGAVTFWEDKSRGISMVTLGSICVIPGTWVLYILFWAFKRFPGFHYDQVPSFDE